MSNTKRECSEYVYNLSRGQMEALMAIAKNQDRPFLEVVMEAVDQYIQRECETCKTP
jgi:hypothetical protein